MWKVFIINDFRNNITLFHAWNMFHRITNVQSLCFNYLDDKSCPNNSVHVVVRPMENTRNRHNNVSGFGCQTTGQNCQDANNASDNTGGRLINVIVWSVVHILHKSYFLYVYYDSESQTSRTVHPSQWTGWNVCARVQKLFRCCGGISGMLWKYANEQKYTWRAILPLQSSLLQTDKSTHEI